MFGIDRTDGLMNQIYANPLEELIYDCGGPSAVARALGIKVPSLSDWIDKGRLPWTELDGRTNYSETLEKMQRRGYLSAVQIRKIGLKL